MKKYFYLLLILALTSFSNINAQQSKSGFDSRKLIYGGDIGFGISNSSWTVGGAPQIGYKLTEKFHIGAGIGYRYGKINRDYYMLTANDEEGVYVGEIQKYKETQNSVSFNLFAHYYPWKKLIFSVKPEIIHTWYMAKLGDQRFSDNKFVPAVVVGGGFHFRPVILQLNYELIQDDYSPYSNNVFLSVGVMF